MSVTREIGEFLCNRHRLHSALSPVIQRDIALSIYACQYISILSGKINY